MAIPNTRRFFVAPELLHGDQLRLNDPDLVHQLGRVLRLSPGDRVLLLDGAGTAAEVQLLAIRRDEVTGAVLSRGPAGGEPPLALTIYLPLIRPERFAWALQKCVELGAQRLVPLHCARSFAADRADAQRLTRWRRIVREAAEQACRGVLPQLAEPLPFAAACAAASQHGLALLLWEGQAPHLRQALRSLAGQQHPTLQLLSGPEGGITAEELTLARQHGIMPVSLGPRTLRAETAPVVAAAAVMYELEQ
ncbi:MAG: 16S rRNA (uracil(1498)-N(3))-methyltransferase [Chloroflexi bacterium]|nr:16S rRNA (uracil(1498)-N(3))-methyltransferase [Chloroflexota bacterium]